MRSTAVRASAVAAVLAWTLPGCGEASLADGVRALPVPTPDLPEVPALPAPKHPVRYEDGSLSVFGLRRQLEERLNQQVEVTAVVVEHYQPPKCSSKDACPRPAQPHLWLADDAGETDATKRLTVVGYASHNSDARRKGLGALRVGTRVRVKGQFAQVSPSGFNASNGLIAYDSHVKAE